MLPREREVQNWLQYCPEKGKVQTDYSTAQRKGIAKLVTVLPREKGGGGGRECKTGYSTTQRKGVSAKLVTVLPRERGIAKLVTVLARERGSAKLVTVIPRERGVQNWTLELLGIHHSSVVLLQEGHERHLHETLVQAKEKKETACEKKYILT